MYEMHECSLENNFLYPHIHNVLSSQGGKFPCVKTISLFLYVDLLLKPLS
jgi:hypothetical protein